MILFSHALSWAMLLLPNSFWKIILGSAVASGILGLALSIFEMKK